MFIRSLYSHSRTCSFSTNIRCQSKTRCLRLRLVRRASAYNGPPMPDQAGQIGPQEEPREESNKSAKGDRSNSWIPTLQRMFESAATTVVSITVLGLAGYSYHRYYKYLVLQKIENAFRPGDPVLELVGLSRRTPLENTEENDKHWIPRKEQIMIDAIVSGSERGHYHLLIGEKGTGKSSMLLQAMQKVEGEGISMFEAHADLEIFRVRLGKALDYEFHEDYIGSLFSIKGPRDTTALLDIERAFNKLEKVALKRRKAVGRPMVLIINSTHLLRKDEDGQDLLELIQQRAEQWAASSLITVVFNSDDYWVYERLKQLATRMKVISVLDLPRDRAIGALKNFRKRYHREDPRPEVLNQVYNKVGGRLTFLNRVARSQDMLQTCEEICRAEKTWFLNKCWILGEDMDDDVMDQQKYASAAMVLAKALVEQEEKDCVQESTERGHLLPQIPLHKAREIMTRADFIESYDHSNIFTIDAQAMVRADSWPMQNAFREICSEEGFDEFLQATLDRISAIESLGRTREIVAKDLVNGKYRIKTKWGRAGSGELTVEVEENEKEKEKEGD